MSDCLQIWDADLVSVEVLSPEEEERLRKRREAMLNPFPIYTDEEYACLKAEHERRRRV